MSKSSIITLNSQALKQNIHFLKKTIGNSTKISSVVKANAYGHGIEQIVPMLEAEGIDHFSVFDFHEAKRVKKSLSKHATIMIMGWISSQNLENAIAMGFEFYVFNVERLQLVATISRKNSIKAKIHLEVETGMNRSGLNREDLLECIKILKQNPSNIEVVGFCTHLAGPESIANHLRIQNQIKAYNSLLQYLNMNEIYPKYRHMANSAAAIVYPKTRLDLVRIGIMQYGFWSSMETFIHYTRNKKDKSDPLQRILEWKSYIMNIKNIKVGEFVGYGTSYLAQKNMKVALIPIGYASGFSRSLSNKGRLIIKGIRCGVVGLVNMNMVIADVSEVCDVEVNDDVVIIGKQGELEIKFSSFSNISEKLNYEILAHLPQKIDRLVI